MNKHKPVTIQAYKYGNRLHYEWQAEIIELTESYVMVLCRAERQFFHHTKGKVFTMPYPSIEVFYFNQWFTAAITFQTEHRLMYYCNIAMPAKLENDVISFIDLDLDYLKEPDEDWKVVDRDEFMKHQQELGYSQELIDQAELGLQQLQQRVEGKLFPFDGTINYSLLEKSLYSSAYPSL
jgi:protein associated with RNAse G/E